MDVDPIADNWYQYVNSDDTFVVVSLDESNNVVEIQHADGNVEEIPLESWYDLNLEAIEAPEDWSGPDGLLDREDADYDDDDLDEESDSDEDDDVDDDDDDDWDDDEEEDIWDDDASIDEDWDDR